MQIFLDTADIKAIKELTSLNIIDGVTTNPSLIAKSGKKLHRAIEEIAAIIKGPISAEVTSESFEPMLQEASELANIASNIVIKLPLTFDGLRACHKLSTQGYNINMTLCFTANQALLAAKAGAAYISPFIGRLDDINLTGMDLIRDIKMIYNNYRFKTQIIAASVRSLNHIKEAALKGADIATIPPLLIKQMINHPLTDNGLAIFRQAVTE